MRIGLILPLHAESERGVPLSYAEFRAIATHAEARGLDTIWVYDHLIGDRAAESAEPGDTVDSADSPWEAWTVLSALADATSTIRLGSFVMCTAFRSPTVLARMADTLQDVSGNRLVLGLGAGFHQPEFEAFGLPGDHLGGRFLEAFEIVTSMLREGRVTYDGRYYQARGAAVRARPGRTAPEILVAARGPKLIEAAARLADSWTFTWHGLPNDKNRALDAEVTRACERVGREPRSLGRTVGILVDGSTERYVRPEAAQLAAAMAAWRTEGADEVVVNVMDEGVPVGPELVDLVADAAAGLAADAPRE